VKILQPPIAQCVEAGDEKQILAGGTRTRPASPRGRVVRTQRGAKENIRMPIRGGGRTLGKKKSTKIHLLQVDGEQHPVWRVFCVVVFGVVFGGGFLDQ